MGEAREIDTVPTYLLLTTVLAPMFPVSVITAGYVAYVSWRRRDYVFLVGSIACIVLATLRNVFVGAVATASVAALYYVINKRLPKGVEVVLWVAAGLSLTSTYFMRDAWGLPEYVAGFRAWWSGSTGQSSLVPAHFVLAFTSLSVAYTSGLGVGSGRLGILANYLRENPGAVPVIAFMVLLMMAAAWLALGLEGTANKMAELAYYFLVAGVALQLYATLKEGEAED